MSAVDASGSGQHQKEYKRKEVKGLKKETFKNLLKLNDVIMRENSIQTRKAALPEWCSTGPPRRDV
jgi:hypothetical protein